MAKKLILLGGSFMNLSISMKVGFCVLFSMLSFAGESAPVNPFLAHSTYPLGHGNSAQQDSVDIRGPIEQSRFLQENEKRYTHLGPMHFGSLISSPYVNNKRVIWSNGSDRIVKVDHETDEVIDTLYFSGKEEYTKKKADRVIKQLNSLTGKPAMLYALKQSTMFKNLAGVYTLLDNNGHYYMGTNEGIAVYGDSIKGDANSKIKELRRFIKPAFITGSFIGMNMSFDGRIILVTEHGFVLALSRDFSSYSYTKMKFSEGKNKDSKTGYGWVRNGFAVDRDGGIYIASQNHMHKVVWTGTHLSTESVDGAWTSPYSNTTGNGTGSTPALMGFDGEDQFVVITDGDKLMNLTLFWRNSIPEDWKGIKNEDMRIAGKAAVDMGDPLRKALQSEQSVVVSGYGAAVVNNEPRNSFEKLPGQMNSLLVGFLGNDINYQPFGVQKFKWNSKKRKLEMDWVNKMISSPNAMPIVSKSSNIFYTVGARNSKWTIEGIDWTTGRSEFHYVVGDQKFNSLFSGLLLDENGELMYGTIFGRVRINLK